MGNPTWRSTNNADLVAAYANYGKASDIAFQGTSQLTNTLQGMLDTNKADQTDALKASLASAKTQEEVQSILGSIDANANVDTGVLTETANKYMNQFRDQNNWNKSFKLTEDGQNATNDYRTLQENNRLTKAELDAKNHSEAIAARDAQYARMYSSQDRAFRAAETERKAKKEQAASTALFATLLEKYKGNIPEGTINPTTGMPFTPISSTSGTSLYQQMQAGTLGNKGAEISNKSGELTVEAQERTANDSIKEATNAAQYDTASKNITKYLNSKMVNGKFTGTYGDAFKIASEGNPSIETVNEIMDGFKKTVGWDAKIKAETMKALLKEQRDYDAELRKKKNEREDNVIKRTEKYKKYELMATTLANEPNEIKALTLYFYNGGTYQDLVDEDMIPKDKWTNQTDDILKKTNTLSTKGDEKTFHKSIATTKLKMPKAL